MFPSSVLMSEGVKCESSIFACFYFRDIWADLKRCKSQNLQLQKIGNYRNYVEIQKNVGI